MIGDVNILQNSFRQLHKLTKLYLIFEKNSGKSIKKK